MADAVAPPRMGQSMQVNDAKKVAVFGAGTMGPGLALVFALGGNEVTLAERKQENLHKAMTVAKDSLATLVGHGTISRAAAEPGSGAYPPDAVGGGSRARGRLRHGDHRREQRGQDGSVCGSRRHLPGADGLRQQHLQPEHFRSDAVGAAVEHRGRPLLRPCAHHPARGGRPRSRDLAGHAGVRGGPARGGRQDSRWS